MSYYYQKIEIDHLEEIKSKCLEYVKSQTNIYFQKTIGSYRMLNFSELTTICPELLTAFNRHNIKCIYAAAFVSYTNASIFVHKDAGHSQARINIPLENCKGTFTEFYKGGISISYVNPVTGTEATKFVGQGLTLVDKVEIDQATVIRISAPHSVKMDENRAPRVTLTLGFNKDPVFLLDS